MLPLGALWLVAHLVEISVVQQYAFVGLAILAVWALVGTPIARFLAFPLGFLLFMVPVGAGLMYPMMNFTADFTVGALRLTGIPVYREGTFFSIPSGNWSVVEACSGIRYLLAAATLGVLYAYLTYSTLWKRLIFIAFSLLVPILANGVRAYMIVMIGHLSDMKLATGVDHLVYGWVFFGIVITLMFAVGAIWRDPLPDEGPRVASPRAGAAGPLAAALAVAAAAALWAGLGWLADRPVPGAGLPIGLKAPAAAGEWNAYLSPARQWDWRPHVVGADGSGMYFYGSKAAPVSLYLGVYRSSREGAELVSVVNQMSLQEVSPWVDKEIVERTVQTPAGPLVVGQHRLGSPRGERLLVWTWYRVGDFHSGEPTRAKLAELTSRLTGGRRDGTLIAVATPAGEDVAAAAAVLQSFVSTMLPGIEAEIDRAVAGAP
jgi:exosortase A